MKFSEFIVAHQQEVLDEWVTHARTLVPSATEMPVEELEDHGRQLVLAISDGMETKPSEAHRSAKSMSQIAEPGRPSTATAEHGRTRQIAGSDPMQMHGEFRALRASILRLWARSDLADTGAIDAEEIVRFNESVDQALAESVERYSAEVKRAGDALRESEEKYRTLFDTMTEGLLVCDLIRDADGRGIDWRFVQINQAWEKQTGIDRAAAIGATVGAILPGIEPFWGETFARVVDSGEPEQVEHYAAPIDRWFHASVYPHGPEQVVVVYNDISMRKRAEAALRESEERQKVLLKLSDEVRPLLDALQIQRAAMRVLGEHLGVDRVMYAEITADGERVVVNDNYLSGRFAAFIGEFPLSAYGSIFAKLREGQPIVVDDIDAEPLLTEEEKSNYKVIGSAAFVTIPLIKKGRWVSNVVVHQGEPRRWTREEVALLQEVAERTWEATERARAKAALRASEERHRSLFETISQGFSLAEVVRDAAGNAVDWRLLELNPVFEDYAGMTVAECVGRTAIDVFGGADPHWLAVYDRVVRSGKAERSEAWFGPINRWVGVDVYPGTGDRFTILYEDISDRIRADAALRKSEERQAFLLKLSDALRPLGDAVKIQGEATHLLREHFEAGWCYYAAFDASGTAAQILRDSVREGLPSMAGCHEMQDLPEFLDHLSAGEVMNAPDLSASPFFSKRVVDQYTAIGMHSLVGTPLVKHGRLFAVMVLADTCTRHWNDDEIGLLTEVAERTWAAVERARAEAALRDSEEALRDADRRKDEFLATLAHELRNPLAPVRNSLHILRLIGADSARQAPLIDMMERQLGHMVRLVDDLMEVSRITRGKIDLQRCTLDLVDVLRSAVETAGPQLQAARVALHLQLPSDALLVDGDAVRLAQVFANLLGNAAKYTDAGGQVTVALSSEGSEAVVSVRDTGTGIPAEMLLRVFELFTQVDRTLGRAQGGLGIGLALVRHLVGLHGGSVEARSDSPGQGSEFVVRLPLVAAESPLDNAVLAPAGSQALVGRRVLVVDDNRDAADTLAMMLRLLGAEVRTAYNGPSALEAVRVACPQVVLLDLGMPGMDGYAVAAQLRSEPQYQVLKLIALSGWGQQEDLQRTSAAGFDGHLVKPVALERVIEFLSSAPGLRRAGPGA